MNHRVHASIAVVAMEWRRAGKAKRNPDLRHLTVKALDAGCASTRALYSEWPNVLLSTDLSKEASDQPIKEQWWLAEHTADDSGEGMYCS